MSAIFRTIKVVSSGDTNFCFKTRTLNFTVNYLVDRLVLITTFLNHHFPLLTFLSNTLLWTHYPRYKKLTNSKTTRPNYDFDPSTFL